VTTIPALKKVEEGFEKFKLTPQKEVLQSLAKDGQRPEVIVVTCSDSRVAPEILFEAEVGQLFVIRVAGNVVGLNELASIEFAALALNVPLCIVLGHSSCGAVSASVDWHTQKKRPPTISLESLVKEIEPAVAKVTGNLKDKNKDILSAATVENVRQSMNTISTKSAQLADKLEKGEFIVKGGVINMDTAALDWLN